jgi:prepilin-type N-terminal cleavage/methylation domain-containing protein
MTRMTCQHRHAAAGRRGFTLVELMIAIALIVVLLLGINQVFKMSSDTIGVGQTYSGIIRDHRATQAVMQQDARQWVVDAPMFYIRNQRLGNGNRSDQLAFPARGLYRRQTPGLAVSSLEAWIWYGHGQIPGSNRDLLCRMAMLLRDPLTLPAGSFVQQQPTPPTVMSALAANAMFGSYPINRSYCDVAGVSLEQLRARITDFERNFDPTSFKQAVEQALNYTFECNIRPARPLDPMKLAQAAPALLENCHEFIVEFAADLFTQNRDTGRPEEFGPDGVLDFALVYDSDGNPTNERRTRWYGMGRDVDGDGQIDWQRDVVPLEVLREVVDSSFTWSGNPQTYVAFWSNGSPTLVRVLMRVEDPQQRVSQWFEFVLGPQ